MSGPRTDIHDGDRVTAYRHDEVRQTFTLVVGQSIAEVPADMGPYCYVVTQRALYLEPEQVAAVQRIIDSCNVELASWGVIPMTVADLDVLCEIVKAAAL